MPECVSAHLIFFKNKYDGCHIIFQRQTVLGSSSSFALLVGKRFFKRWGGPALVLIAMLASLAVWSVGPSPVGLWKSIDDVSGNPRSLIRITASNGILQGRIEKVFLAPNEDPSPKCEKFKGSLKKVPVIGLVMLTGLRDDGDEYVGGQILDPDSGNVYRSKVQLIDGGKKLRVRGYVGIPMLGRSQTWERQQ